jgi:hypothetical protein
MWFPLKSHINPKAARRTGPGICMLSLEEHLENLIRHINLVRDGCILVGKKLISKGDTDLGRLLIWRGFQHDISKFIGIEFDFLHNGKSQDKEKLNLAIKHHTFSNEHHPEFWSNNINNMPKLYVMEMVIDWYARAQEFGTDLKEWVEEKAIPKFNISKESDQWKWIEETINLLIDNYFVEDNG